ncbi:MAG: TIM barrel protein, partial [Propionivibrio sp.]
EETRALQERLIRYMHRLKISMVRIMSYAVELDAQGRALADQREPERLLRLERVCKTFLDAGILPLHENCHTFGGMSWEHSLKLVDKIPGLKLVFDTGNPPLTHDFRHEFPYPMQSSWKFYQQVKEFVAHVHIKDAIYDRENKQGIYTFPGEGDGDVARIVADLLARGYDGAFSIEPHMAVVFHDASVQSDAKARYENFVTYGRKWGALFREAEKQH